MWHLPDSFVNKCNNCVSFQLARNNYRAARRYRGGAAPGG